MAPVHEAARLNDVESLGSLLDAEPNLLEEPHEEDLASPLHYACEAGSVDAARLLLDRGADIDERNALHCTPLMIACHYGRAEVVSLLLARGADPLMPANSQLTPFMFATSSALAPASEYAAVLRLLLEDGRVSVNARDRSGWTALAWACSNGYDERVEVLVVEGRADHTIPTNSGRTPMETARRSGHLGCVRLLEWYEGELEKPFLLSKARAVVDGRECILRAGEKVGARTEAEAQQAREEAAPAYLRGRVANGEPLPEVVLRQQEEEEEEEEECGAVCEYLLYGMKDDLVVEVMEGLR